MVILLGKTVSRSRARYPERLEFDFSACSNLDPQFAILQQCHADERLGSDCRNIDKSGLSEPINFNLEYLGIDPATVGQECAAAVEPIESQRRNDQFRKHELTVKPVSITTVRSRNVPVGP